MIDHFSRTGTAAITDFWEQHLLTPTIRSLIRDAGGALFEDSLELETDSTLWTPDFPAAFERLNGYALAPYLPLLVKQDEKTVFNFDAATSASVRRDVNLTLTDLYNREHLRESLGFKNLDDYKRQAGARDFAGNTILSNEAGATAGGAYGTIWETELRKLAPEFAAGVNQHVFHGFSYATTPESRWPGFSAFSPLNNVAGYGESWGPRQPTWTHASDISGYFARNQLVMQSGRSVADAAVLVQTGYVAAGYGAPFFTADTREASQVLKDGGNHVGWIHETISESLLDLPNAVARGKRLAPDGPNFKALVLEGDVAYSRAILLRVATARKLLEWAKAATDYYFIANSSATAAASVDASFAMTDPAAVPYVADAWSAS